MLGLAELALCRTGELVYGEVHEHLASKGRPLTSQHGEAAISQRYTVHEAAPLVEISVDAVRKRATRGPLNKKNAPDVTMYIRPDTNRTATTQGAASNPTAPSPSELIEGLWLYIESVKSELAAGNEELRRWEEEHREQSLRKDHLFAKARGRVPGLEVPSLKPRNAREGHVESPQGSEPPSPMAARGLHTGVRRPWWLRLLGG